MIQTRLIDRTMMYEIKVKIPAVLAILIFFAGCSQQAETPKSPPTLLPPAAQIEVNDSEFRTELSVVSPIGKWENELTKYQQEIPMLEAQALLRNVMGRPSGHPPTSAEIRALFTRLELQEALDSESMLHRYIEGLPTELMDESITPVGVFIVVNYRLLNISDSSLKVSWMDFTIEDERGVIHSQAISDIVDLNRASYSYGLAQGDIYYDKAEFLNLVDTDILNHGELVPIGGRLEGTAIFDIPTTGRQRTLKLRFREQEPVCFRVLPKDMASSQAIGNTANVSKLGCEE